ncbi:DUF4825 domain-containing protein [Caldibacillus sp. 210928-DFI.2.22]|uniref:DUF4825 domain-containing protein n=1 Tax=Bacillaceae TaxID=186817 RepID=UPI000D554071|nr:MULTISPECIES: DUF4825 domain-containing protein [Bacillaceae]AWI10930.1 DUF4825 domain-containing protein [Caldibacillus thermoamylovorans]MCB7070905.1 DUF4825 domain-containing protein [Caldibacillus sp. 210928-DFI.2.22]MCB7074379.1 DUF4825 domain-containing protein [Caldibacillus sp. 210928-DFI.2.18]MDL0419662.1 DUF4825 domain-containing protein [Caldibacillus thermoamylovorans]MED3643086.1 DUF4825 domain-containing protein [Caldifermentibacillus hisashii]
MKRITIRIISLLSLMMLLTSCSQSAESKTDLFQYKNSYVGDNSAVGNIVNELTYNNELNQISLETKKEPYGIILEYKDIDTNSIDKEMKETVITNSTFLFALIKNVDWITFKFPDKEFSVTREKIQEWYNNKLDGFENEQDLKKLIQEHLKSEKTVSEFFNQ